MKPLTQGDLNRLVPNCSHDDHGVMFLHPRCHPGAGNEVSYDRTTGCLTIKCNRCKQLIVIVEVQGATD